MTFQVRKFLFLLFLASFIANLTFSSPQHKSERLSLYRDETDFDESEESFLHTHDIAAKEHYTWAQNNGYHPKPTTTVRVDTNPWVRYNSEENKENRGVGTIARPLNLNSNTFTLSVGNRNRIGVRIGDGTDESLRADPKRKSEFKCEEYGRAIERKSWVSTLVGTQTEGIPVSSEGSRCEGRPTTLIVGGTKAQAAEFPHMAALGWPSNDRVEYLCGGSLISEQWILTAAHCVRDNRGAPSVVRLGANVLSDNTMGQVIDITRIEIHPTYDPPAMYADIALLQLKTPIKFTEQIRPACLYQEYDNAPRQAIVSGWGVTQIGDDSSDALLKVSLYIIDNIKCARQYNQSQAVPRGVVPSMLCAGDLKGDWQADTCQGDSGGPLQVIHPTITCLYQIVGITSFGKLCALRESPGVYTRVSQYLDWIEGYVWPERA